MTAKSTSMDLQENAAYIQSVLAKYGFRNVRPSHNGFTASCPFHEDKHPSFGISKTGLWCCFSCKAKGNLKHLHKAMGGGEQDWKDSLKELGVQLRANIVAIKKNTKIDLPEGFSKYGTKEHVPEYIAKRLKWETIHHFGLGEDTSGSWRLRDRCIIPIKFNGKVVGWHARALKPEQELRYYNPAGFDIKEHIFNHDSCIRSKEVIVVEGAFNAMSMWENGFERTIAVFGTQFTTGQLSRIMSINPSSVVICFDRDPSKIVNGQERGKQGQKAAHKLGKMIHDAVPAFIMPLPVGLDPNDLSASVLRQCYNKKVSYESVFGDR
jgi:DNA primase